MLSLVVLIAAYLIGSISTARIIAAIKGIRLSQRGTKNYGATNVYKLIGPFWGILTGVVDFCKGFLPVYLGKEFFDFNLIVIILIALGAIAGHNWPLYYNFNGGRGLATSMGTLGVLDFNTGIIAFISGTLLVIILRKITHIDVRIPYLVYPIYIILVMIFKYNIYVIVYGLLVLLLSGVRAWQVRE